MGDLRFPDLLVSWQALKMTLAIIPGICLVVWAGSAGWSGKRANLRDLWRIWRETDKAKHEGLKECARTVLPVFPTLAYLLLIIALYVIPADTLLLLVVNVSAMPAAIMSYREGRKMRASRRGLLDWHQFDLPWPSFLMVMGLWLMVSVVVLLVLRVLGVWHSA